MKSELFRKPKSLLGNFLSFLKSPNLQAPPDVITLKDTLGHVLRLYGLKCSISIFFILTTSILDIPNGEARIDISDIPMIFLFASLVIIAPLFEEAIFRLPLRPLALNITISCSVLIYRLSLWSQQNFIRNSLVLLVVNILIASECPDTQVFKRFYSRHPRLIFYGLTLLFGAIHINNYTPESWYLLPLLVFPQTISGLFLGFVRMRYGFWWAVFMHALHNSLIFIPIFLVKVFGSTRLQIYLSSGGSDVVFTTLDRFFLGSIVLYLSGIAFFSFVMAWKLVKEWISIDRVKKYS